MKSFHYIALLMKKKRESHPKKYSQSQLSFLLGFKNGQYISNIERGLANLPFKYIEKTCETLDISVDEMKSAMQKDLSATLDYYLSPIKRPIGPVDSSSPTRNN